MSEQRKPVKPRKFALFSFLSNVRGSTAISFALGLPVILTGVGLATDYGFLEMKRSHLQGVADQAAIGAVKELTIINSKDDSVQAVADSYARSQVNLSASTLTVQAKVDRTAGSVEVVLKEEWTPFFAHFLNQDITPVTVNAKAQLAGKSNLCVLALDPSATKSIHMDKRAKLVATGCAVYANSSHNQAIRLDQDSSITSSLICAVGGVKAKTSAVKPVPSTDCASLPDPLADRVPPAFGKCLKDTLEIVSGTHILEAGRYCNGLKITGDAKVTFEPGNYNIENGAFEISGNATVISENAAFYLSGEATTINFTGNTSLELKGAKDGAMAGLLFFEERSTTKGRLHRINSANASELTGTIYLPNGHLLIDPSTPIAQDSAYTAIIARTVELNEGPTLVLNDDYSESNVPVPTGIQLSTQVVLTE